MSLNSMLKTAAFALSFPVIAFSLSSCEGMKESTKKHSPQDTAAFKSGDLEIAVHYSQPYKKGRLIFGTEDEKPLVTYGEIWRTGANEATQMNLSGPIKVNDELIPAGTYTIYTIPNEKKWVVAINAKTDYWGRQLMGSPYEVDQDVVRMEVPVELTDEVQEQFTIDFIEEGPQAYMRFRWDQTSVKLPFGK